MPFISSSDSPRAKLHLSRVKTPALVGIAVLCLVVVFLVLQSVVTLFESQTFEVQSASSTPEEIGADEPTEQVSQPESTPQVVVHVAGAVNHPGVYTLDSGSRILDAVQAADGFTPEASQESINCARVINDGEQILVPTLEQASSDTTSNQQVSAPSGGGTGGAQLVNINTASAEELCSLSGVGPSTAQKIIEERQANGPFATKEDLQRVSGIGQKKYAAVADAITVG